jgi:hypothetical protein
MHWVGFDVGKAFHWVCVLDGEGEEVLSRRVEASEEDLEAACSEIAALGGEGTVGIDLMGGPATLLEAILLERGEKIFHVPGIAVNRARDAYPGESKSDARDARVIAKRYVPETRWWPRCGCLPPIAGTYSRTKPDALLGSGRYCSVCSRGSKRRST